MATVTNKALTSLTVAGSTAWIGLGLTGDVSGAFDLALVGASSAVIQIDYSDDGSAVATSSPTTTTSATALVIGVYPLRRFARFTWVSGTATSITPTYKGFTN